MSNVTPEAATLLMILMGATAKHTNVVTLLMFPLIAAPAPIIASMGIPNNVENAGSKYTPLNAVPNTVMITDPAIHDRIALLRVFLNI